MQTKLPLAAAPIGDPRSAGEKFAQARSVPEGGQRDKQPAPAKVLARIADLQNLRQFCIKAQSRADRSMESLIARYLGYSPELPEKERKALFLQASTFRKSVEKGREARSVGGSQAIAGLSVLIPLIIANAEARKPYDKIRTDTEAEMRKLAKQLPVYEWVDNVEGFGALGLAIVVAEAGRSHDLSTFATKQRLWKMLELAVIDGERQQRKSKPLSELHGYGGRRRAEMWAQFSDSMFKHQWRGEATAYRELLGKLPEEVFSEAERRNLKNMKLKELRELGAELGIEAKGYPLDTYGRIYQARRQHTAWRIEDTKDCEPSDPNKWTPARCDRDARRIMTKAVIADLWKQWVKIHGVRDPSA